MKIVQRGVLSQSVPGTDRAVITVPAVVVLGDGTLLATCRTGSTKDGDDDTIEFYRSDDNGWNWSGPGRPWMAPEIKGFRGSLKSCYLTELSPGRLLAACLWVDRESYPGCGLFNPETEGCLPLAILLSESTDLGLRWSSWRVVPVPEDIGPPSLTGPAFKLPDGTLCLSIESNKTYEDTSKWYQKVVLMHSQDEGLTWGDAVVAGQDPSGRIYNWDQRVGVALDGRIVTFLWTYDSETGRYLNIHRRLSADGGFTWSQAEDLGFTDQAAHPAVMPDGRVVLPWVDRFHSQSIRARLASGVDAPFAPETEVVIYSHEQATAPVSLEEDTGELLEEMALWTFGLPFAEVLPDGSILVLYYAGVTDSMICYWVRIDPDR